MDRINPHQRQQRSFLRVVGPAVALVGAIFLAIGLIDFFSAFGGRGFPTRFWCAMVGLPILGLGILICKFAFMAPVARYAAGELAPVGKDTFNYLARETRPGVADVSEAFHQGRSRHQQADTAARLKKLEDLRDSGIIDADDFEQQKLRILSEI